MIYRKGGNFRADQRLLGHAKLRARLVMPASKLTILFPSPEQLNWERTALCDTRMRVTAGWEDWRFPAQKQALVIVNEMSAGGAPTPPLQRRGGPRAITASRKS